MKFLAKICSDINKPDGVCILREEDMPAFLAELPVAKIPGVGRHTREALARFGITKAGDMLRYSSDFFASRFGKSGLVLLDRARGIDPGKVEPCREIRSESAEDTLLTDTRDRELLKEMMRNQSEEVAARLRKRHLVGSTATVKIKYDNFKVITRSRTFSCPLARRRASTRRPAPSWTAWNSSGQCASSASVSPASGACAGKDPSCRFSRRTRPRGAGKAQRAPRKGHG